MEAESELGLEEARQAARGGRIQAGSRGGAPSGYRLGSQPLNQQRQMFDRQQPRGTPFAFRGGREGSTI